MFDAFILIVALVATAFTIVVAGILAWLFIQEHKDD